MQSTTSTRLQRIFGFSLIVALLTLSLGPNVFAVSKKELRRVSDDGPVAVAATYLNPLGKSDDNQQSFEVTLDTHSVNLSQYRLEELSTLRVEGGGEMSASGWKKPGGGGHHISGIVTFDIPDPVAGSNIELIVRDVGGVKERVFKWQLPQQ